MEMEKHRLMTGQKKLKHMVVTIVHLSNRLQMFIKQIAQYAT